MTTLDNQKIRYDQRMLNPRYAEQVADRHTGWTYSYTEDVDKDGTVDLAIRDANGELVWFNGYRRKPAQIIHIKQQIGSNKILLRNHLNKKDYQLKFQSVD